MHEKKKQTSAILLLLVLVTFDFTKGLRGCALKFTVYLKIALNVYCRFPRLRCEISARISLRLIKEASCSTGRSNIPDLVFYCNSRNMEL